MEDDFNDIVIEALEVFINHILYTRDVYPAQIFKKRRMYNTPVYTSIYPPLNTYIYNVFRILRELLKARELECVQILLYKDDSKEYEKYNFKVLQMLENKVCEDEFLMEFEEQLRSSLYTLAERLKNLEKLPSDCKFKIQIYTTQAGFVRLSHNPHYQEFPWLRADLKSSEPRKSISLLPLTTLNTCKASKNCDTWKQY
ncbi:DNA polymerase zeta subunit 2 [Stomoxys calcitrans]|uniref:DNA polymerase zeta subunit 2 n=1 Tax=Stomoxys calcitrans TaxID=35570 RepID=UPI0027E23FCD|nr:DNA polymerase zeta subunit 2 [Stomoxys calcitrans]